MERGTANQTGAVVVADVISNLQGLATAIRHQDVFLSGSEVPDGPDLQPDLLITFGLSNISKHLKLFLRSCPATSHWHLQAAGPVADPFQSLTRVIRVQPENFFAALTPFPYNRDLDYQACWQQKEQAAAGYLASCLKLPEWNEFIACRQVMAALPGDSLLHLANSMAVRYANLVGLRPDQKAEVFANRGTSGIDGCTSTAVGAALSTDKPTVLFTGDLAFFYDRNALWHNYLPANLRIVVFNNHGGGIFRLLPGPRRQPELEELFETRQQLDAASAAREFKLRYFACHNGAELAAALPEFWSAGAGLLEIFTEGPVNAAFFEHFKKNYPFRSI
jgi:2-succinyl-5-enolpyruvyl-6-hydroxy-3-cyclohexene-1-carboxylate synthase